MVPLTESEKSDLIRLLNTGQPVPEQWRYRLFPSDHRSQETGKEYRLVYDGKLKREEVLAQTPAAPWQFVRRFCRTAARGRLAQSARVGRQPARAARTAGRPAGAEPLRHTRQDQADLHRPALRHRQDFMKDREKAYRDKVLGAQFIEFLRRRLILLRELLADDGSIYVHLDTKKGHYLKAMLDEVSEEENFQNEIVWKRTQCHT